MKNFLNFFPNLLKIVLEFPERCSSDYRNSNKFKNRGKFTCFLYLVPNASISETGMPIRMVLEPGQKQIFEKCPGLLHDYIINCISVSMSYNY